MVRQVLGATEGAVTTDGHDTVDQEFLAGGDGAGHALLGLELGATVGIEHRAAVV